VDGSGLSFPDAFGSTQMMCEEAAMQVEQDFISRLEGAQSYEIALQGLIVWSDAGLLSFLQTVTPLKDHNGH
jgi:heat shock protein HslJ